MPSKPHRVFCIGFMKTGTTTLHRALTMLGYRVSHDSWRWLRYIVKNDWKKIGQLATEWDALEDNPIPLIYKELDEMFPGSKFILTIRDHDQWYQSVSYHIGNIRSPMHEWLFGKGKGLPKEDRPHAIRTFSEHTEKVKAYFAARPDDLLVVDITKMQGWDLLCNFLGEKHPSVAFPHANQTAFTANKHAGVKARSKYWKKKLIHPIKIFLMDQRGYLPTPEQRIKSL